MDAPHCDRGREGVHLDTSCGRLTADKRDKNVSISLTLCSRFTSAVSFAPRKLTITRFEPLMNREIQQLL